MFYDTAQLNLPGWTLYEEDLDHHHEQEEKEGPWLSCQDGHQERPAGFEQKAGQGEKAPNGLAEQRGHDRLIVLTTGRGRTRFRPGRTDPQAQRVRVCLPAGDKALLVPFHCRHLRRHIGPQKIGHHGHQKSRQRCQEKQDQASPQRIFQVEQTQTYSFSGYGRHCEPAAPPSYVSGCLSGAGTSAD